MEGDAADSQLVDEENGLTEEVQVGYGPPESLLDDNADGGKGNNEEEAVAIYL